MAGWAPAGRRTHPAAPPKACTHLSTRSSDTIRKTIIHAPLRDPLVAPTDPEFWVCMLEPHVNLGFWVCRAFAHNL